MESSGKMDNQCLSPVNLRFLLTLCVLCVTGGSLFAQNYQCPWSVVDIGGGAMSSTSYRTSASVGQTAAGQMSSTSYQSFIGFWQIDTGASGVQEESHWNVRDPLVTRLFSPTPNPCPRNVALAIHYTLGAEAHVTIQLYDLLGRRVRNLVNTVQRPERYSVQVSDFGPGASRLAPGVYFVRFRAGDYEATSKVVCR